MKRRMTAIEEALTQTNDFAPLNAVIVLPIEGDLPPEFLRQTLDWLQRRHPHLGFHIVTARDSHYFESDGTPEIPLKIVERDDNDQWQTIVEYELNTRINYHPGPLIRCTYLHKPGAAQQELIF